MSESQRLQDVEMQLSEIEMLQSMFPDEIIIPEHGSLIISTLAEYLDKKKNDPNEKIEFIFEHNATVNNSDCMIEASIAFPLNYPSKSCPEFIFRSPGLNRQKQQLLNEQFQNVLSEQEPGEICMFNVIEWVKENVANFLEMPEIKKSKACSNTPRKSGKLCRIWIYSHHIYSKIKRKNILEWAKELNLTGFSMPGKPGVVCVEGPEENCEEFWQRNKRQTWKRLCVILREVNDEKSFKHKFFDILEEKDFGVHGGRDYHMDLGKFAEFLQTHDSKHIFPLIFGIEAKSSSEKT